MSSGLYSGVSGLALGVGLYKGTPGLWSGASGLIDGFGGDAFSGASLFLNFLSGTTLDSRVTFTRGTNATLTDGTGRVTYAPNNIATQSNTFTAWASFNSGGAPPPSVTASFAAGPDGVAGAASRLVLNTGSTPGDISQLANPGTVPFAGLNYIISVWMRSNTGADQTVSLVSSGGTGLLCTVTSTWQRFSFLSATVGTNQTIRIRATNGSTTNLVDILAAYAQAELVTYQTTPSTYVATTSAAYFGPRFDFDPVTLAPRGLLIEEARTNLLTFSEQFDNAAWTKLNATVTANTTTAPDGTLTADTLSDGTATDNHGVRLTATPALSTTYAVSVFAKMGTRRYIGLSLSAASSGGLYAAATFDLQNGVVTNTGATGTGFSVVSTSIQNVGNGWYRCVAVLAFGSTGTALQGYISTSSDGTIGSFGLQSYTGTNATVFLWGAQLEAGAFATSYIPTVASTVTRNADVATMSGTNFSSWFNSAEGAFIFSGDSAYGAGGFIGSTPTTGAILYANSNASRTFNGTNFIGTANTYTNNVVFGTALGYSSAGRAIVLNGGTVATDANLIQTPTAITLGGAFGGGFLNGHIRQIAYYNTRLPNAQLQALTAPTLALPLSLDFTTASYTVGY